MRPNQQAELFQPGTAPATLAERLIAFREARRLTQAQLAVAVGVKPITVLRWETGTSKPAVSAAHRLEELGLTPLSPDETKRASIPRLALADQETDLRAAVRGELQCGPNSYPFVPSPYVVNGPADQLPLFEALYALQSGASFAGPPHAWARRLSTVASVPALGVETAQHQLERRKATARSWNGSYGPHGWHRYVGRFPPHLVRALLSHFNLQPGSCVVDPFAGSGTTLTEARLLGYRGLGIDVCPLSCMIARAKSQFPADPTELSAMVGEFEVFYADLWQQFVERDREPNSIPHGEILRRRNNPVPEFENVERWFTPEALLGVSIAAEFATSLDGYARDFFATALSAQMRSIGNVDVDVVRAEYRKSPRENVDVCKLVIRRLRSAIRGIHDSIRTHSDLMSEPQDVEVREESVLDAHLEPGGADCIITSPPYGVESLSYLRTHLLSYRSLASILKRDPYEFDDQIIGNEYLASADVVTEHKAATLSRTYREFFDLILAAEPTGQAMRRSQMMMRFFDDLVDVADRCARWLAPGGQLAFVIGNKRLGDSLIPTNEIVREVFEAAGLQPGGVISHKLKCNNSNSEVPWQERTIQDEFVMLFCK